MEQKIAYVQHPVTPERKAELRGQGYIIVDIAFKPASYMGEEPKKDDSDKQGKMTVEQIKEELAVRGIAIPDGVTKKADLLALLEAGE